MRVAVLSFAHVHAATYIGLLRDREDIELITADPDAPPDDPTRGRDLAERLGAAYVDTWDEAFALSPDAVVVTSENARHRHLVERAAAAGAHVLCEKPLATTEADARAMIDACARAGVGLMTAYPVRFSPAFVALRRALADGLLGGLISVHGANNGSNPARSRPWFADPELAGGGALADHTVHLADLVDALLDGEQAAEVYAQANSILDDGGPAPDVETAGLVTIRYPGGVVAGVDASWSHPPDHPTWGGLAMTCVGEKAIVEFDAFPAARRLRLRHRPRPLGGGRGRSGRRDAGRVPRRRTHRTAPVPRRRVGPAHPPDRAGRLRVAAYRTAGGTVGCRRDGSRLTTG